MKKLYKLLLAVLLLPAIAFAQSNFKPGYIVTLKGDTIRGMVDYQEWDNNPGAINFKTADAKINKYTPATISYFSIDNREEYQKYTGPISRDETYENRVLAGRDTSFFVGDVFLKVLQKGKTINFYEYTDAIKSRFFYNDHSDNTYHELVYRVYYNPDVVDRFKGRTVNENTYLQQLTSIALKAGVMDDKLQSMMEDANYNKIVLLKIASKMNGLSNADLRKKINSDDASNFDVYAGVAASISKITPVDLYLANGGKPYSSVLPKALVGFNVYANPNTRRVVVTLELSVTLGKYESIYDNKIYPYKGIHYGYNQVIVSATPQVSYNFYNADNFKVFATFGFDISHYSYTNHIYEEQDGSEANYGRNPFQFYQFINSPAYKLGVLVNKRVQVYAYHVQGGYINYDSSFDQKQSTYQIGLNYILGKQK
ncbi:hypothetical protein FFF34_018135 [Inquilinus sp. KBS0705]|nr:hypothetical protein FFF34_018135 [Inquilinus sp. KBS0705]